jgi:hypothetical protein
MEHNNGRRIRKIYIANNGENMQKVGKKTSASVRACQLKKEGYITSHEYSFHGDNTQALLMESILRTIIQAQYNGERTSQDDYFRMDLNTIQEIGEDWEFIVETVNRVYRNSVNTINREFKKHRAQ